MDDFKGDEAGGRGDCVCWDRVGWRGGDAEFLGDCACVDVLINRGVGTGGPDAAGVGVGFDLGAFAFADGEVGWDYPRCCRRKKDGKKGEMQQHGGEGGWD